MPIYTTDNKSYNISFSVSFSMKDKSVSYVITTWDKIHHSIKKYIFKDGEFAKACDKLRLLEIEMLPLKETDDFITDLQAEQKEQM